MKTVSLTQYIHPNGRAQQVYVELPDDVCEMAQHQILSCECYPHDYSKVVFYSRLKDEEEEEEEIMLADNGPGDNAPPAVLANLIRKVNERK